MHTHLDNKGFVTTAVSYAASASNTFVPQHYTVVPRDEKTSYQTSCYDDMSSSMCVNRLTWTRLVTGVSFEQAAMACSQTVWINPTPLSVASGNVNAGDAELQPSSVAHPKVPFCFAKKKKKITLPSLSKER